MTKTGGATGRPSLRPYSWNTDETYCFYNKIVNLSKKQQKPVRYRAGFIIQMSL